MQRVWLLPTVKMRTGFRRAISREEASDNEAESDSDAEFAGNSENDNQNREVEEENESGSEEEEKEDDEDEAEGNTCFLLLRVKIYRIVYIKKFM